jgi:hypothetical protein
MNLHEHFEHAGGSPAVGHESGEDTAIVEFDFEAVARNLDGESADAESARQAVLTLAASGLAVLLDWIDEVFISRGGVVMRHETSRKVKSLILRNYVRGEGLTLEQIGGCAGIAKQHVSEVWLDFCERFHVTRANSRARLARRSRLANN